MKAIFFDIDGTIYHPEIGISQNTIDEIHRVQKLGHKCFIASGRPTGFISKEVKSIGFDGFVLANGAHIVTEGKTIDSLTLPYDETKKLIEYVESQGYEYILLTTDRCYLKKESPHMYEFYAWCNIDMDSLCNDYDLDEVLKKTIKLEIRYNKKEDSVGLIERLGAFFYEKHDDSLNVEVSNIDTSKGHGIETMLNYYGLDVDDSYCFGDGANDLEMFKKQYYDDLKRHSSYNFAQKQIKQKILDLKNKYKSHLQEETNCKIGKNINFVRETELKAKISVLIELENKLGLWK